MSNTEKMQEILYGAAYYDEYMPYDRLDQDIQMLQNLTGSAELWWMNFSSGRLTSSASTGGKISSLPRTSTSTGDASPTVCSLQ